MDDVKAFQEFDRYAFSARDFEVIRKLLLAKTGINLSDSKPQMVYSRLSRRLQALRLKTFQEYIQWLQQHPEEHEEFVNALTTNLTAFFREAHHFDVLADHALKVFNQRKQLRCWCAAASTGEEPYSIAMTLAEAGKNFNASVEIIASDIDSRVLSQAQTGVYDIARIKNVPEVYLKKFFLKGRGAQSGKVKVTDTLKNMVDFRQINLLDSRWSITPPFDIIFCRNVMIYFDKKTQLDILQKMIGLLSPDGLYIAGHSESFVHASHLVTLAGKSIYRPVSGSTSRE